MSAQLVFGDRVDRQIHVASRYAPTRAAPREVLRLFWLQCHRARDMWFLVTSMLVLGP